MIAVITSGSIFDSNFFIFFLVENWPIAETLPSLLFSLFFLNLAFLVHSCFECPFWRKWRIWEGFEGSKDLDQNRIQESAYSPFIELFICDLIQEYNCRSHFLFKNYQTIFQISCGIGWNHFIFVYSNYFQKWPSHQ